MCIRDSAMVVPRTVEPSLIVTTALASPVPLSVAFDVILSVDDEPVSLERLAVTVGAVVSRVNASETEPVFPAASVSLATSVCAPLARPVGVNDHAPLAFAVAVPRTVEPSLIVTTALASPVPLSAALEVILSVDNEPVSLERPAVTVGAVVS